MKRCLMVALASGLWLMPCGADRWIAGAEKPAQPWGGAALGDWAHASKALVLSEMGRCTPGSALTPGKLKHGSWTVVPYEMRRGVRGTMVFAAPEANAPEVSLPLRVSGWYAIFLGLFGAPGFSSSSTRCRG